MIGLQRKTIIASTGGSEKRVKADQETSEMSVLGIQQQTKESESSTNLEKGIDLGFVGLRETW